MKPSGPFERESGRSPPIDRSAPAGRPAPPRAALSVRRWAERRAARARIAARPLLPPSVEQRAFDPMARGRLAFGYKLLIAVGAVAISGLVHGGVYGFGSWFGDGRTDLDKRKVVAIEMREPVREPEPPPPPPPPPEPERIEKPRPERRKAEPPPPDKPPPEPTNKPPPRVTGLNFESTSDSGSGSFAVGNTRRGETARRAVDPKSVDRKPQPPPSPNQKASRIPTSGAKYVLPKRKRPIKPPYPKQLLTQGIEAAVTVMVSLDATGKVTNVKIIRSAAFPEFDEAAVKTAWKESFEPATRDGTAIPYTLSYTYRFTIDNP